jgi:hypothetical protein
MCCTSAERLARIACALALSGAAGVADAQPVGPKVCSIESSLPGGASLYHVGTVGGTSSLGAAIELDDSGIEVKKVDVLVNLPGQPIVLVLSASSEPVVWNVAWTPGSRIVGAVVSGSNAQAVLGLPRSIPLYLKSFARDPDTRETGTMSDCPYVTAHEKNNEYPQAEQAIRRITGLAVRRFIQAPEKGIALVGESVPAHLKGLESSRDYRLEEFILTRKPDEVPAGVRGLEELAKRGSLRHASAKDIRRFEASGIKGIIGGIPTYVVLKPITLPRAVNAYVANILVPEGIDVAAPEGDEELPNGTLLRLGGRK